MQTCRLRAARGRGTAAYPLHPRSLRRRALHESTQTRRHRVPASARLSGRTETGTKSALGLRRDRTPPITRGARASRELVTRSGRTA
jgi:hypothetical protein